MRRRKQGCWSILLLPARVGGEVNYRKKRGSGRGPVCVCMCAHACEGGNSPRTETTRTEEDGGENDCDEREKRDQGVGKNKEEKE